MGDDSRPLVETVSESTVSVVTLLLGSLKIGPVLLGRSNLHGAA
jgi:hypothetical protein